MSANLPIFPSLPGINIGAGVATDYGTLIPPGSRATYVRSTGFQSGDPEALNGRIFLTLAAGLAECRSGLNDFVFVLPGHSESVTTGGMSALVAGTHIIGLGNGGNRPVFRWTATTSQWAIAVADVTFSNLRLRTEGAVVVKAIAVTAADVVFDSCEIENSSGASNYATICVEFGVGSSRGMVSNTRFRGLAAGTPANAIKIDATTADGHQVRSCTFICPGHATTGQIQVSSAVTNFLIADCVMYNTLASSQFCITIDAVAANGIISNVHMAVLNAGIASAQGISFGATSVVRCIQTFCTDEASKNAILAPAAAT
jgi:hypothetical protein